MSTTYSVTDQTPKDKARFLLGDTGVDGGTFLLQDEEIASFLSGVPFNDGVALIADGLATRFAQFPDEQETAGGSKTKWSERVEGWRELAHRMRTVAINPTVSAPRRRVAALGSLANPTESRLRL